MLQLNADADLPFFLLFHCSFLRSRQLHSALVASAETPGLAGVLPARDQACVDPFAPDWCTLLQLFRFFSFSVHLLLKSQTNLRAFTAYQVSLDWLVTTRVARNNNSDSSSSDTVDRTVS